MLLVLLIMVTNSTSFNIIGYDAQFIVGATGVCTVSESITVDFRRSQHGFLRILPTETNHHRLLIHYFNISVDSQPFQTEFTEKAVLIRIGNPSHSIIGVHTYRFSYTMSSAAAEGHYSLNVIGFDWEIPLTNVTFSVTYPPSLDLSQLLLFSGVSTVRRNVAGCKFSIAGHSVMGQCERLPVHAGVTISVPISFFTFTPTRLQTTLLMLTVAIVVVGFTQLCHSERPPAMHKLIALLCSFAAVPLSCISSSYAVQITFPPLAHAAVAVLSVATALRLVQSPLQCPGLWVIRIATFFTICGCIPIWRVGSAWDMITEIVAAFAGAILCVYGVSGGANTIMNRNDVLSAGMELPDPNYVWNSDLIDSGVWGVSAGFGAGGGNGCTW
jgi:hypothetical protein